MNRAPFAIVPLAALALAAFESEAEQQAELTEDRIGQKAGQSAAAAGDQIAAMPDAAI